MKTTPHLLAVVLGMAVMNAGFGQPTITRQPTNLSLSIGATATFRVTATAKSPPLSYQWRHQNTALANATNATLAITNLQPINAGPYTVTVSDAVGSILSNPADLDVDPVWTKVTSDPILTGRGYDFTAIQAADYDNDGDQDLLWLTDRAVYNPTYRNNGDGTFTQIFEPSLQSIRATALVYTWADYDNDGWLDLFVPAWNAPVAKNVLQRNNGNGTFSQITQSSVTGDGAVSLFGAWADYDRDGDLDLFVATSSDSTANALHQNQGDGTFLKLTNPLVRPLLGPKENNDILAVWVDMDEDGWQDLFITTQSSSRNRLYRNTGNGGFLQVTSVPMVTEYNAWGDAAWADYDNDGDLDVLLTTESFDDWFLGPLRLYRNNGQGRFAKLTAAEAGSLVNEQVNSFSVSWGDYDNDGWLDVFVANGVAGSGGRTDLLYRNNGDGTFTKVLRGSPASEPGAAWGGFWVDLDNDGFLDLLTLKHATPDNALVRYFHNNGNANHWLAIRCEGTASPRFATGTKVRIKTRIRGQEVWQLRVIDPGGFVNAQNVIAHFGLGDATRVEVVRIEWTSGLVQELTNVPVRQYLTVTEPLKLQMPRTGELNVQCWKGQAFAVETSSDLFHWTVQATVTNLNVTGGVTWMDPDSSGRLTRFYRAVKR